jgi:hypothetical protein
MKAILPQIILLPVLAWLVWGADIWTAASLYYPAYLIIAAITCGLIFLPFAFVRRSSAIVVPCMWIVFLITLPFVPNSSLKVLMWGVRDLEQGMDRETVMETLNGAYSGSKYPEPRVFGDESRVYHTGDDFVTTRVSLKPQGRDPSLQAESLSVYFADGGFRRTSFSAD